MPTLETPPAPSLQTLGASFMAASSARANFEEDSEELRSIAQAARTTYFDNLKLIREQIRNGALDLQDPISHAVLLHFGLELEIAKLLKKWEKRILDCPGNPGYLMVMVSQQIEIEKRSPQEHSWFVGRIDSGNVPVEIRDGHVLLGTDRFITSRSGVRKNCGRIGDHTTREARYAMGAVEDNSVAKRSVTLPLISAKGSPFAGIPEDIGRPHTKHHIKLRIGGTFDEIGYEYNLLLGRYGKPRDIIHEMNADELKWLNTDEPSLTS